MSSHSDVKDSPEVNPVDITGYSDLPGWKNLAGLHKNINGIAIGFYMSSHSDVKDSPEVNPVDITGYSDLPGWKNLAGLHKNFNGVAIAM